MNSTADISAVRTVRNGKTVIVVKLPGQDEHVYGGKIALRAKTVTLGWDTRTEVQKAEYDEDGNWLRYVDVPQEPHFIIWGLNGTDKLPKTVGPKGHGWDAASVRIVEG
jgi:hypothetical protein